MTETRRVQDPKPQTSNPEQNTDRFPAAPQPYPHEIRGSQDFFGGTPVDSYVRDRIDTPVDGKRRALSIVLGTAVGSLLVGGGLVFGVVKAVKDSPEGQEAAARPAATANLDPSAAQELPPLDIYTTDITREEYGRQLDVTLPYLQERRTQSLEEVSKELEKQNRLPLDDPNKFPVGSPQYEAQVDQNNKTADLWTISGESNTTLARNLLNSVVQNDPENSNDSFDVIEQKIGNGQGRILEATEVLDASPAYTSGVIGTSEVNGPETYIALLGSRTSGGTAYEQVISERHSQDGEYHNNVVIETIQFGGPGFVMSPSTFTPQTK